MRQNSQKGTVVFATSVNRIKGPKCHPRPPPFATLSCWQEHPNSMKNSPPGRKSMNLKATPLPPPTSLFFPFGLGACRSLWPHHLRPPPFALKYASEMESKTKVRCLQPFYKMYALWWGKSVKVEKKTDSPPHKTFQKTPQYLLSNNVLSLSLSVKKFLPPSPSMISVFL